MPEARPLLDIEAVMQNICIAALSYDLGTRIADQGVMYPEVLRRIAGIPESRQLVTSIAIGYPNWKFPADAVESTRKSIDDITTWRGF